MLSHDYFELRHGDNTMRLPWTGANTDFEYVTDSKYSIDGDEEILEEIS